MKKRSKSQRLGTRGENHFRDFAERHGLIANKVEQDFGTDFLCQVESALDGNGTALVAGSLIGAFVRSSTQGRGRVKIERDDAEHLLACDYPIAIVIPHSTGTTTTIHARFVDDSLGKVLAEFLAAGKTHFYLTPGALLPEAKFDMALRQAVAPGFVERVRVHLAEVDLASVIPRSRIEIHRSQSGQATLVAVGHFLDQFDTGAEAKEKIYAAIFGHDAHFQERLSSVPVRPDLLGAVARLPSPIVIHGPLPVQDTTIVATSPEKTEAPCSFECRLAGDPYGWVHPSGFALTVSQATLHEGKWVHFLRARVDPKVPIDLRQHEDLWRFLEACVDGGRIKPYAHSSWEFEAADFEHLPSFGYFARHVRQCRDAFSRLGIQVLLGDNSKETLLTLEFFGTVISEGMQFGFAWRKEPLERLPRRFWVPVVANMEGHGLVIWMLTQGDALAVGDRYVGYEFRSVERLKVRVSTDRFQKGIWPEIVVHPELKSIPVVPSAALVDAGSSSPEKWDCGFVAPEDGEPEGVVVELLQAP